MLVNELVSDTIKASLGKREDIHCFRAVQDTQEWSNKIKKQALDHQDSCWKSYSRLTSSPFVWKVCTKMKIKVKGVWHIGNVGHMKVFLAYILHQVSPLKALKSLWKGRSTYQSSRKISIHNGFFFTSCARKLPMKSWKETSLCDHFSSGAEPHTVGTRRYMHFGCRGN